jgi:hypothetical protein
MMGCALAHFLEERALKGIDVVVLMEITMANLLASGNIDDEDSLLQWTSGSMQQTSKSGPIRA